MNRGVLVLGVEPRITVAIARSLHRHGIPVVVAAISLHEPYISSRAVSEFVRLPDPQGSPSEFLPAIESLVRRNNIDLLIPATDAALTAVSHLYKELNQLLQVACPPPHIVERILNKELTLQLARQCGIRVPREYEIRSAKDLETVSTQLSFPVVAKPRHKSFEASFKVRYFQSLGQLRYALASGQLDGALLQEYCPGVGVGVEVLLHGGECVAVFQHRRLKEMPHDGGAAVMAVSEAPDPNLAAMAQTLLRALEWTGVAMVEFRCNPRDGTAALMEVNGRYWGTLSLAIQCGVDFPLYQWQLAHQMKPQVPSSYALGGRWRWSAGYVRRLHGLLPACLARNSSGSALRKDLLRSPLDFAPSVRDAMWSWSDPVPTAAELLRAVVGLLRSDVRAVARRILPRGPQASAESPSRAGIGTGMTRKP
jgi:predicted ATP-grasp superfamily ATP-dependent carboligase